MVDIDEIKRLKGVYEDKCKRLVEKSEKFDWDEDASRYYLTLHQCYLEFIVQLDLLIDGDVGEWWV